MFGAAFFGSRHFGPHYFGQVGEEIVFALLGSITATNRATSSIGLSAAKVGSISAAQAVVGGPTISRQP